MSISYVVDLETIEYKPTYDSWLETQQDKENLRFPPPFTWEIICLGYAKLEDLYLTKLGVSCNSKEKEGLELFSQAVEDNEAQLITYNGRSFDLPVISYRCLHYGIPMGWYHEDRSDYKYRYKSDKHFDVKDYLSEYGQHLISLDNVCKLIGLPGKMDTKGEDVVRLHALGKKDDIIAYCITDVLQTLFVFYRLEYVRGALSKTNYLDRVSDTYKKIVEESNLNLKTETLTHLGNNINKEETLAIAKGCRILIKKLDIKRLTDV